MTPCATDPFGRTGQRTAESDAEHGRISHQAGQLIQWPRRIDEAVKALREISCFAYRHSPFYAKRYKAVGVNPATALLPDELPLVFAPELVASAVTFRTDLPIYRATMGSGTTGKPKLMFRTEEDFRRSIRNEQRLLTWAGIKAGDVVGIAQPYDMWGSGELIQRAASGLGATVVPVGYAPDDDALAILSATRSTVLDITPSRLERILKLSLLHPPRKRPRIRVVMVSGEPLPDRIRNLASRIWGAAVYNQYGSEETDALAGEKYPGGGLSLLSDDFIYELLDPVRTSRDAPEVSGRLVVTSLYHRGTPLIRYVLDDSVTVYSHHPDIISVRARSSEHLLLFDGVRLEPRQIDAALNHARLQCTLWQCSLYNTDGCEHLVFRFVPTAKRPSLSIVAKMRAALEGSTWEINHLIKTHSLRVSVKVVNRIAPAMGERKVRRFVDLRKCR